MAEPISIIVPVFDEADNVSPMAREVAAAFASVANDWELVFVDDGSREATWARIAEAARANPRVRGVRHTRNAGQSAALWTGIQVTTRPLLATLDAISARTLKMLENSVAQLKKGKASAPIDLARFIKG